MSTTKTLKWDLYFINGLSLLLIGVIAANQGGVDARVVLPFILFFPALIAALFPGQEALERAVLSFGLSIAVVPGLVLNCTPWGIHLAPILVSLVLFTFLLSAFHRRSKTNTLRSTTLLLERIGLTGLAHANLVVAVGPGARSLTVPREAGLR